MLSKTSFANIITVNGGSGAYTLGVNDTLFIASGTYTGIVSGLSANNRTIIVAGGATFQPSTLQPTNGVVCKIINYGTFTYTASLTTNTDFTLDNYAGGIVNLAAMNTKGKNQVWTNHYGGTINFSGAVLINGGTLADDNNVFINYETINASGNFQMNSGSSFTNYKDFNVSGDFKANGGNFRNEGNFVVTGNIDLNSGATPIVNTCRMEASGGIDVSNGTFTNYSYVWAKNSDITITGGGTIMNIPVYNNPPMIHGRNYEQKSGSSFIGPAFMYFYGTTKMGGGTIGVPGVTVDTIKMYDVTRTVPTQIFDVLGGTIYPNVIYNAWGVPDSNKVYLLGCSIEVILESPLPIKWNYFFVSVSNKIPALTWSAEFSRGTVFNIQRSYDGTNFSTIDYMPSESSKSEYNYNDQLVNPNASIVYYRIKGKELSGEEKYSPVRVVRFGNNQIVSLQTAPNPFANNFNINYAAAEKGMITIRMFNINGQQQLIKNIAVNSGNNIINVSEASQFAKGMYVIQISNENGMISSAKIVKQ